MSESIEKKKNVVIGAGLAGLSCAVRLHEAGRPVEIFEASDGVGGRVRTDRCEGFLLDRGFQVYLDAYPEAGRFLDLEKLDLRSFEPGALVWKNGRLRLVMDVFRRPLSLFSSALAPIGSLRDKALVALLRRRLLGKTNEQIWKEPGKPTAAYLRDFGFSEGMIDGFFRGFYGGIFLEDQLSTSSRLFEFTFKMFAQGFATLPARGIQAIPDQLAARLPAGSVHLNCGVRSIEGTTIHFENGAILKADRVIVATDGDAASGLVPGVAKPNWNSTSCLYFAADRSPVSRPIIVLKGDRKGLINNVSVPSLLAPDYAPEVKALISVSVLGDHRETPELEARVRQELVEWFGADAATWQHLRTGHIRRALPVDTPGNDPPPPRHGSVHVCGDHTASASIEGAIQSGLRAADQILSEVE